MATRIRLKNRQLAAELAKSRLSQNRWAERLELGRGHLSLLVNGRRPYPSAETRRKLLEGLGVPFSTLFEVEEVVAPGSDRPRHRAWLLGSHRFGTIVGGNAMNGLGQDLRFAFRGLVHRPLFSIVIVLVLALGIGANTALFGWMRALVLEPLRVEEPDRWVNVGLRRESGFVSSFSYPNFLDHQRLNDAFDGLVAVRALPMSLSSGTGSVRATGALVSASYFSMLDVPPRLGRTFTTLEDTVPGRDALAVLTHGFWQRHFGGDPGIVGRAVTINAHPFTIVGVMPPDFGLAKVEVAVDVYVPLAMQEQVRPGWATVDCRDCGFLSVMGRYRAGYDQRAGAERANAVHARIAEPHESLAGSSLDLVPTTEAYLGGAGPTRGVATAFKVLMALMGAVLLLCCANVAGLLLARAVDREREIGIRQALGAGRRRLLRQMLVESLLLSMLAAFFGVGLAFGFSGLIRRMLPPLPFPLQLDVGIDVTVLLFTALVALGTGVLFGITPALRAARFAVLDALRGNDTRVAAGGTARRALVAAQVALSVVLLFGAGLFLRSLQHASDIEPGFEVDGLLVMALDPGLQGYSADEVRVFYRRLLESTAAVPAVRSAGLAEMIPLGAGGTQQWGTTIEGYHPAPEERMNLDYNYASPGYFATLGVPLVTGRAFTSDDDIDAEGVVIVNQTAAERYWPGQSPLGRILHSGGMERRVVGVVGDLKYYTLGGERLPYLYFPSAQSSQSALALHVKTDADPASLIPTIRERVRDLDADLPLFDIRTMRQQLGIALAPSRLIAGTLALFGALALLLSAVGLYGTIAYAVGQRSQEIGIRMALGAGGRSILRLVVRQTAVATALGAFLGLLGGVAVGRLAAGVLYGVSATDPRVLAGALGVIALVSVIATAVPARRATAIDPVDALRAD